MIELNSSNYLFANERIKIPFHDLDPGNVVWHGRYFKYFESARTLLFEGIGYSFDEMSDSGILWPVVDVNIRYVRALLLNQEVYVTACLKEWELRLVVEYEIVDGQGVTYTRARTVQAPVHADTHQLVFGSPDVLVSNVQKCLQELSSRND
jgi:acyl-CoA thioester hydrolase